MNKAPAEAAGKKRKRFKEIVIAFFGDRSSDREDEGGLLRITAVAPVRMQRRCLEALKIHTVVAKRYDVRPGGQVCEMAACDFGTGHDPRCFRQLCALLPFRLSPDVLCVSRNRPVDAGQ